MHKIGVVQHARLYGDLWTFNDHLLANPERRLHLTLIHLLLCLIDIILRPFIRADHGCAYRIEIRHHWM